MSALIIDALDRLEDVVIAVRSRAEFTAESDLQMNAIAVLRTALSRLAALEAALDDAKTEALAYRQDAFVRAVGKGANGRMVVALRWLAEVAGAVACESCPLFEKVCDGVREGYCPDGLLAHALKFAGFDKDERRRISDAGI